MCASLYIRGMFLGTIRCMDTVYDTATNEKTSITVHRKKVRALTEGSEKIQSLVKIDSALSASQMAIRLGIAPRAVESIAKFRKARRLTRVGLAKGGRWDVIKS